MMNILIEDLQHPDLLHSGTWRSPMRRSAKWGLPEGFMSRVVTRPYGTALVAHFASRLDQIHFKLFALVDQGGGRHEADLRALSPTPGELAAAARWSITQDPSPGYRSVLVDALRVLGVDDADLGD
jgi:hypothetical protein